MTPHTTCHRRALRRRTLALGLAALGGVAGAAVPALAQDDGSGASGGAAAPGRPAVSSASCGTAGDWTCARGQVLTLTGTELSGTSRVVFLGGGGVRDDVRVTIGARAAAAASAGELLVVVPRRARSGPLLLVSAVGAATTTTRRLSVLRRTPGVDDARGLRGLPAGGRSRATLAYTVASAIPAGAAVEAVRAADGAVVRRWPLEPDAGGEGEVRWDGFARDRPVKTGTYVLRLDEEARAVATPLPGSQTQVKVLEAVFPVRGAHRIGRRAMQRFGGGRGHQGQDVFARCGTPLAALTRGVVAFTGVQSAAGNYVVVNTPDGRSYAYMHLRSRALVAKGDRVVAGERLGFVGQTGRASGCHLHVELWTAPGWYRGGHPYDPLLSLLHWDASS